MKECKSGFYLTYDERYCEECDLQHGKILYSIYNIDHNNMVNKCYTKVDNCKEYSEKDDFCELCEDGFQRNENGKYIQCGKNEIGMNNVCFKKKIDHCLFYYLFIEGEKCLYCEENYEYNEEQGKCIECPDGYKSEGYFCHKEVSNCKYYDSKSRKCANCERDYELKGDEICSKCPEGKTGEGLKCFDLIEGCGYQNNDICERCSNSELVLNEEKNQCIEKTKIEHCSVQVNDKCTECYGGYKPSENQKACNPCESGKDEDIFSCLSIENCISTYGIIKKYKRPIISCRDCRSNEYYLTASRQQCNDCGKGKYKLNDDCIDEIKNCVKYKSNNECEQCVNGYEIKNGKCSPCVIPYEGYNGKTCILTHFLCQHDDEYGNCFECLLGFYLSSTNSCHIGSTVNAKDISEIDTSEKDTSEKDTSEKDTSEKDTNNSFGLNINIILLILFGLLK